MNLERLKKGVVLYGDSHCSPRELPEWMDMKRFRRGQIFFQRHSAAIAFALHCSLTIGFSIESLLSALVFTEKSCRAKKALYRYFLTFAHLIFWHTDDVWDPDTLGYQSVQLVRRMHESVRRAMDVREPKVNHISQYDMAIVQMGFSIGAIVYPREFGIRASIDELNDYIFFWRGIGYLLGIDDEHNVCSGETYGETCAVLKEIEGHLVKALYDPPEKFHEMATAYIDGSNLPLPFRYSSKEAVIGFAMNSVRKDASYKVNLSMEDKIRVVVYKSVILAILWLPGFETFFNYVLTWHFKGAAKLIRKQLDNNLFSRLPHDESSMNAVNEAI